MEYEDNEGDKVLLSSDDDLVGAINHAKLTGWKVIVSSSLIKSSTLSWKRNPKPQNNAFNMVYLILRTLLLCSVCDNFSSFDVANIFGFFRVKFH